MPHGLGLDQIGGSQKMRYHFDSQDKKWEANNQINKADTILPAQTNADTENSKYFSLPKSKG